MKKWKLLIICAFILILGCIDFINLYSTYESMVTYVIKPTLWLCLFISVKIFFKDDYIRNTKYQKDVTFYVLIATVVYFMSYFFIGYVNNFANNPYNRSITGLILNVWTFCVIVISKEYLRYYLINNCDKKRIYLYGVLISFMFAFTEINKINFLSNFESFNSIIRFIMESVMPEMFISLFLSYITYYAGYKVSLIYKLVPIILTLTLRILPNINWMLHALIKSIVPFFTYLFISNSILKIDNEKKDRAKYKYGFKFWIVSCIFLGIMVSFGLGFLPYYPVVIATASMEPNILVGDIVIIKKAKYNDVKVKDVIEYGVDNYEIVHRVIEKRDDGTLICKGDNNESIDLFPVKKQQINGIIKVRIPYLGYPTLFINDLLGKNLKDEVIVETGK